MSILDNEGHDPNGFMNQPRRTETANTDRELWRDETKDYYPASLFVTKDGGIGINVGGTVFVKPIREWWRLAKDEQDDQF